MSGSWSFSKPLVVSEQSVDNLLDPTGTWNHNNVGSPTPTLSWPNTTSPYPGYEWGFYLQTQSPTNQVAYVYKTLDLKGPGTYTISGSRKISDGSYGNRMYIQVYDNTNSTYLVNKNPNNTVGEWYDFAYTFYVSGDVEIEVRLGAIYNNDGWFAPNLCLNKGAIAARRVHKSILGIKGDSAILDDGNVGIGTTSPSGFDVYNKEINQTFRVDGTNIHRNNKYYADSRDTAAPNTITTRYAVSAADNDGANARRSELVLGAAADQNSGLPGSSFISFSDNKKLYLGSHPDEDFMSDWNTVSNQAYPRMGSNTFAPHVTLLPSGNVGIGTTSPSAKLNIQGTSKGAPPSSGGEGTSNGIFRLRDDENVVLDIGTLGVSPWSTWLQVSDGANMSLEYPLALQPNGGNVGIGTTNPSSRLDVTELTNSKTTPALTLRRSGVFDYASPPPSVWRLLDIITTANGTDTRQCGINLLNYSLAGTGQNGIADRLRTGLGFSVHNENGIVENALVINKDGNVGIGKTNPSDLLSLYKNSTNGTSIKLQSSGDYYSTMSQKSSASNDRSLQFTSYPYAGANHAYKFLTRNSTDDGWNDVFNITGDGSVGIGTSYTYARFHNYNFKAILTKLNSHHTKTVYKTTADGSGETRDYYSINIGNSYTQFQVIFRGWARNNAGNGSSFAWRRQYTVWRNLNIDATILHDSDEDIDTSGFSFGTSLSGSSTGTQTVNFEVTFPAKAPNATYITFHAVVVGQDTTAANTAD